MVSKIKLDVATPTLRQQLCQVFRLENLILLLFTSKITSEIRKGFLQSEVLGEVCVLLGHSEPKTSAQTSAPNSHGSTQQSWQNSGENFMTRDPHQVLISSAPRCGSGPKCRLEPPPPPPPCALGPVHPTSLGHPLPEPCKKSQGGGGKREERAGREGVRLEGRSSNYNGGWVGGPPSTSWGQTHIWGLPIICSRICTCLIVNSSGLMLSKNSGVFLG